MNEPQFDCCGGNEEQTEHKAECPALQLRCMDAVEWLRLFEDGCCDLLITDPPYESLEKYRSIGTTTRLKRTGPHGEGWFAIFPNERFPELLAEIYRVMQPNSHFYLFCDQATMWVIKPIAEAVGFKFWKSIVWDKVAIGMGYHYRSRHEFILFFEKGKRKLYDLGIPDILAAPRVHNGYPTEKPFHIVDTLIYQSANEGELVLDPFMGSGVVGEAALRRGCTFRGNDSSEGAVGLARKRCVIRNLEE